MGNHPAVKSSNGRRAAEYWFIDGLPEIAFGLVLALWGVAGLLWRAFLPYSWMRLPAALAGVALLALFLGDRQILGALKARLTYPRTGYVRPPKHPESGRDRGFVTLQHHPPAPDENVTYFRERTVMMFILGSIVVSIMDGGHWSVVIAMCGVAAAVYGLNRSTERPFPWWAAVLLAASGFLPFAVPVPERGLEFLPLILGGAWLLLLGASTRFRYTRANPRPRASEGARP